MAGENTVHEGVAGENTVHERVAGENTVHERVPVDERLVTHLASMGETPQFPGVLFGGGGSHRWEWGVGTGSSPPLGVFGGGTQLARKELEDIFAYRHLDIW